MTTTRTVLMNSPPRLILVASALGLALGILAPPAPPAHASPGDGDSLSVRECVELARQQSPRVLAARQDLLSAAADSAAAARNARPDLALTAGALVAPRDFYDPTITNLGEYSLKAGAEWTVADGGRRSRERARSALELAASRWQSTIERRDVGLAAASTAIHLLELQEVEGVQRGTLDWLDRTARLIAGSIASGTRGPSDSVRVQLARDEAAAALEDSLLEKVAALLDLELLTGVRPGPGFGIRSSATPGGEPNGTADSLLLMSSVERLPELAVERLHEAEAALAVEDARHQRAPSLRLAGDAGLAGADLTRPVPDDLRAANPSATFSDRLRRDLGASVGLSLEFPLFDRAVPPATEARRAAARAAQIRRAAAEQERRRDTMLLIEEERFALRRLHAAEATRERAAANVTRVRNLYSGGAASILDLLDARRIADDAALRVAEARAEHTWASFQIEERR